MNITSNSINCINLANAYVPKTGSYFLCSILPNIEELWKRLFRTFRTCFAP